MTSREAYEAYTSMLDQQYAEASQLLSDFIASLDWDVGYEEAKELRNRVIDYADALVDLYGGNASVLASDFYEAVAAEAGVDIAAPTLPDRPERSSLAASMRNAARPLWGENRDVDSFRANAIALLVRYVKRCANDTISLNCKRDGTKGVRWARVPRGTETCPFCIMLASRGFVYYSEQSAELFGHEHEHCDCDIVPSFDSGGLEGYDEGRYKMLYDHNVAYDEYGHVRTGETLRNIRESVYFEQREHINEVRRRWYARNAEKERKRQEKYRDAKRKAAKEASGD